MNRTSRLVVARLCQLTGLLLVGVALCAFGIVRDHQGGWLPHAVAGGVLGVAGGLGSLAFITGKRLLQDNAAEALKKDPRLPVLYLRSFRDDVETGKPGEGPLPMLNTLSTEEEQLRDGFLAIGPMVAAGIKNENLQPVGGFRFPYMAEENWRDEIRGLMKRSALVVIRVGRTPSLLWELQTAVQTLDPRRLVLLVPDESEYDPFRETAGSILPRPLPAYKRTWKRQAPVTTKAFVYFSPDWTAKFVPLEVRGWRAGKPFVVALADGLRPVCEQLRLAWRPAPLSYLKVGAVFAFAAAMVLVLLTKS